MVPAGEGDETGAGNAGGQLPPGLEWGRDVVTHVHDERRRFHFGQKIS